VPLVFFIPRLHQEQLRSFRLVQEEQMFTRHQANGIDSGAT